MQMTVQSLRGFLSQVSVCMLAATVAWADDGSQTRHHQADAVSREQPCRLPDAGAHNGFAGVQVETSDIRLYEQFFETVLQVPVVQRADHPQADSLRGYCYRGVLIVVRQDFKTPRPTGWVQVNFTVPDVAAVQEEIERSYRASPVSQLDEAERAKMFRVRLKSDVMRGDNRAIRLEVFGPEGFMIGFDQYR